MGKPTKNRAREGAVAGLFGAATVSILERFMGFVSALAITVVVVVLFLTLVSLSSRE